MQPGDAAWSRAEAAWLTPPEPEECPDCEDGIVVEVEDGVECSEACGFGCYRPEPEPDEWA